MQISDLNFKDCADGCKKANVNFANGLGASVITGSLLSNLFEIAILKDGKLHGAVKCDLSEKEATAYLEEAEALTK